MDVRVGLVVVQHHHVVVVGQFAPCVIPFGSTGYVALFEIRPAGLLVIVHAVRHQREEDYH